MRLIASFVLLLATTLSQVAMAQELPTRVGRLAFTEGGVALFQEPEEGWGKAYVNSPITSENSIWTDPGARAEMRVSGVALRLDDSTQLDIAKLDEDDLEAFVAQGSVAVRVRHFSNNDRLDFATPHAHFRLYGVGRYRIDVDAERDETVLTVFTGTASMRSASGDIRVDAGGAVRVEGGANAAFVRMRAKTNAFDRWTLARDQGWTESRSLQYVSADMTGYEDLDRYGSWAQEPEYGAVWFPRSVARDWVPYRQGRWDYVRPWGWTWIGEEPWGYAPYHYGRWVYVRDRWGWYPGPRTARPAWAPALVGFVGGASFSVGISGGSTPAMGWYPLAPWERYEPWYRTNTSYVNRINVNVRDTAPRQWAHRDRAEWRYANRDRAATVVRRDAFIGSRPVEQNLVRVTPEAIRQAPAAPAMNLLPGREEFRREARTPAPTQNRPGTPARGQAPQQQAAEAPFVRPGERGGPSGRPNFERREQAPAPAPAPATAQQPAAQQPGVPSGRPFGRDDQRTQERAAREAQQQQQQAQERAAREAQQTQQQQQQQQQRQTQERAAREAQQAQERAAREGQQAQERAAREAQQGQQQQRQAQERAAREAQQAQERGAREAQQVQERAARDQQQQLQDRARAQEQQQRQQHQQQQQQQQAQERAAREAQRQQEQQQQAQERAAREAQRGQPAAAPPPAGREAAPAQPAAPPAAQPAAPAQPRGRDKDKDKEKEDDDKPGKGRGR